MNYHILEIIKLRLYGAHLTILIGPPVFGVKRQPKISAERKRRAGGAKSLSDVTGTKALGCEGKPLS